MGHIGVDGEVGEGLSGHGYENSSKDRDTIEGTRGSLQSVKRFIVCSIENVFFHSL